MNTRYFPDLTQLYSKLFLILFALIYTTNTHTHNSRAVKGREIIGAKCARAIFFIVTAVVYVLCTVTC